MKVFRYDHHVKERSKLKEYISTSGSNMLQILRQASGSFLFTTELLKTGGGEELD